MSALTKKKLMPASNAEEIVSVLSTIPTQNGLTDRSRSEMRSVVCGSVRLRWSCPISRFHRITAMKKTPKTNKKLLPLSKETVRTLDDKDLKGIEGGGSCYKPPVES